MSDKRLLIATKNPGKVLELRSMLDSTGIAVEGLDVYGGVPEVEETGTSFLENARLKATQYARATGLPALADDSGLEVAALGGRPGVLSARYGGDIPYAEKIRTLLSELATARSQDRSARFVSAIAVAGPDGEILRTTEGICNGRLTDEPRGNGGFGYDPVFVPDGYEMTFAELPGAVKAQIGHRGRAFSQIIPFLRHYFGIST